jgi:hypothetical protein
MGPPTHDSVIAGLHPPTDVTPAALRGRLLYGCFVFSLGHSVAARLQWSANDVRDIYAVRALVGSVRLNPSTPASNGAKRGPFERAP